MVDSSFIVALSSAQKLMALTAILSRSLQKVDQDLFNAMDSVNHVLQTLTSWREASGDDDEKDEWSHKDYGAFTVAEKLADSVNTTLMTPRLASKQANRNNIQSANASEYFRRAIWNPFLDYALSSLREKFSEHHLLVLRLIALVPAIIDNHDWLDVVSAYHFYQRKLTSEEEVRNEFFEWKKICLKMPSGHRPSTPIEALDIVPSRLKNIETLLTIFCTIPVTTCTAERAFSAMRLLKNHLRTGMNDERLTGLALMYIHPEIDINVDDVIDRFATTPETKKADKTKNEGAEEENKISEVDEDAAADITDVDESDINTAVTVTKSKRRRLNLI